MDSRTLGAEENEGRIRMGSRLLGWFRMDKRALETKGKNRLIMVMRAFQFRRCVDQRSLGKKIKTNEPIITEKRLVSYTERVFSYNNMT
jgi:hypothetical protein